MLAGLGGSLMYSLPPLAAMRHGWGEPLNALLEGREIRVDLGHGFAVRLVDGEFQQFARVAEGRAQLLEFNPNTGEPLDYVFVALVEELEADRKTVWFGAFVILSLPYVNEKRAEVIRDIGYWAFVVTSLLLFLRFGARPSLGRALAWSLSALTATLFRIEGFAALLASADQVLSF